MLCELGRTQPTQEVTLYSIMARMANDPFTFSPVADSKACLAQKFVQCERYFGNAEQKCCRSAYAFFVIPFVIPKLAMFGSDGNPYNIAKETG